MAGADIVGLNCMFDPMMTIENIRVMKTALDQAGLSPFLMTQPNAYWTTGCGKGGWLELPEFPLALEPRLVSRIDIYKYAREAYELGVRYIGGCCGFESYHIRAIAEELVEERGGKLPPGSNKSHQWGEGLKYSSSSLFNTKANRKYWENLGLGEELRQSSS